MDKERYEKGLAVRREVLGAEYVDRALKNVGDFDRQFQNLVTEAAWGECWGDPTLERTIRAHVNTLGAKASTRTRPSLRVGALIPSSSERVGARSTISIVSR